MQGTEHEQESKASVHKQVMYTLVDWFEFFRPLSNSSACVNQVRRLQTCSTSRVEPLFSSITVQPVL